MSAGCQITICPLTLRHQPERVIRPAGNLIQSRFYLGAPIIKIIGAPQIDLSENQIPWYFFKPQ